MNIDNSKLIYHPKEVYNWFAHNSVNAPVYVEISPVNYCNQKCIFCGLDAWHGKEKLNTKTLEATILELAQMGTKSIMFAGAGESLLHPDLPEIVKLANDHKVEVSITTNGSVDNKLDILKQNCSWIKISFDAGDMETYKKVHGVDMFDAVVSNIKKLVSLEGKAEITMQFLVLEENIHSIEEFIKLAESLGVDRIILKPYSQHLSSINKRGYFYYEETIELIDSIVKKYSHLNINFRKEAAETKSKKYDKCYSSGRFWSYIECDGNVYACSCFIGDERFVLGNINQNCFFDIWNLHEKREAHLNMMENFDINSCRLNCRMESANKYLWDLKNPGKFVNFI